MKVIQLLSHAGLLYVLTNTGNVFIRKREQAGEEWSGTKNREWKEVKLPRVCEVKKIDELS